MKSICPALALTVVLSSALCFAQQQESAGVIHDGSRVSFNYVLSVDGRVIDSSERRGPIVYTHGEGTIIPGLSARLAGLKAGEEETFDIPPEEAYGMRDEEAMREIPQSQLPQGIEPFAGMPLQIQSQNGRTAIISIAEVKQDTVIVDFNHPLAGKTLNFRVHIISVQ